MKVCKSVFVDAKYKISLECNLWPVFDVRSSLSTVFSIRRLTKIAMSRNTPTSRTKQHSTSASVDKPSHTRLEAITPEKAIEMFTDARIQELRPSSQYQYESALGFFAEWCDKQGMDNLNDLTGRKLHQYRIWRREDGAKKVDRLSQSTEKTQQTCVRQFIKYCEQINAARPNLHETVVIPNVSEEDEARDEALDGDHAQEILDWLNDYHYASLEHAVWTLLVDTGARTGTVVGLDIDDYRPNGDPPHLRVRHRPDTGTNLKNGKRGERLIALSRSACTVIDDYIEVNRPSVTDDHGRQPLLATSHGRISKSTVRKYVYKWTRPCATGNGCPHSRDPDECEATKAGSASKCPSTKSPHTIRRGYITHQLKTGVEQPIVGSRCDVTADVLEQHYDGRDEQSKMEVRHRALTNAQRDHSGYGS